MLSYCLKCKKKKKKKKKKNTESIGPKVSATSNGKTILSKYAICGSKKSNFIKK